MENSLLVCIKDLIATGLTHDISALVIANLVEHSDSAKHFSLESVSFSSSSYNDVGGFLGHITRELTLFDRELCLGEAYEIVKNNVDVIRDIANAEFDLLRADLLQC